ncbi:MAG TPA: BON domain-containing protein [Bryobacteraceae bacterium]|jgi:hyperosmotically inducible protein|nr:BON domain-containing protein [Bryobacteraceae bacterium]
MKASVFGRFLMVAALLGGAGIAGAADRKAPPTFHSEADMVKAVRHAILMYPRYSMFDDVNFQVDNGTVRLVGEVTQPFKKSDIAANVRHAVGADRVQDDIRVLPLSPNDARLRLQVAHLIYSDPSMTKYAIQAIKPIHIIVENGHVTLDGMVATSYDKQIAGLRADRAMSFGKVVNNLQVENPSKKS